MSVLAFYLARKRVTLLKKVGYKIVAVKTSNVSFDGILALFALYIEESLQASMN
jgi:multisubunit Na+/H+ antiporter MnhF subunit